MSYADALADLKATFGTKKLLTPSDIAPFVGKSPAAQAKLRERDKFPIKVKQGLGNRVVMSIYDVAHFIGDDAEQIEIKPSTSSARPKQAKTSKKTAATIDKTKPIRRPPSLGATLRGFRARINALSSQLQFELALFAELEAIHSDKGIKRSIRSKRDRL